MISFASNEFKFIGKAHMASGCCMRLHSLQALCSAALRRKVCFSVPWDGVCHYFG